MQGRRSEKALAGMRTYAYYNVCKEVLYNGLMNICSCARVVMAIERNLYLERIFISVRHRHIRRGLPLFFLVSAVHGLNEHCMSTLRKAQSCIAQVQKHAFSSLVGASFKSAAVRRSFSIE